MRKSRGNIEKFVFKVISAAPSLSTSKLFTSNKCIHLIGIICISLNDKQ